MASSKAGPKGLIVMELPDELLNRNILEKHFQKYGNIERMSFSSKNRHCIIHFSTPEQAATAKAAGGDIDPRFKPAKLYFTNKLPTGSPLMPVSRKVIGKVPSPPITPIKSLRKRLSSSSDTSADKRKLNSLRLIRKHTVKTPDDTNKQNPFSSLRPSNSHSSMKNPFQVKTVQDATKKNDADNTKPDINPFQSSSIFAVNKPTTPSSIFSMNKPTTTPSIFSMNKPTTTPSIFSMNKPTTQSIFSMSKPNTTPSNSLQQATGTGGALIAANAFGRMENIQPHSRNVSPKPIEANFKENKPPPVVKPENKAYDLLSFNPDSFEAQELFTKKYTTAEEKYRALESRDKLLRARIPKVRVRVELATKLFGTCPDMCPEKERYMRQYQRQLTGFEIQTQSPDIVVDHRRAIKVYSRSSADQEEPLPHELRPGSTLEMTMNYLLHKILPMAEGNEDILGDWYNFLWDRTRSIRKDITQQQLTNLQVVGLMEKCARFHIHCSSRLCELDLHTFDPKLNDENLMKCLQSLEHLYDDLRRRNIKCPNEPEFRAYQIMMNLNEGDILWDAQQRPEWVFKSPEVQLALKIHHSIFNRNFVEFFRLIKNFPYMFSCILHRYFFQVRGSALKSLWKSHSCPPKLDVQMSYSGVQRMLGYGDSIAEFEHLCQSHGINCDRVNNRLVMNRRSFITPDNLIVSREKYLIESKLKTSIAEAVNGEPLGPDPSLTYVPHCSFDNDDRLIPGLVAGASSAIYSTVETQKPTSTEMVLKLKSEPDYNKVSTDKTDSCRPTSFASIATQNSIFSGFLTKPAFQGSGEFRKTIPPVQSVFGGQGGPEMFKPFIPTPVVPQIKIQKEQIVDESCNVAVDKILTEMIDSEVHELYMEAFKDAELERKRQLELQNQEMIRSQLANEAVEKFTATSIPLLVADVVQKELQLHHLIQKACENYVENMVEDSVDFLLPMICKKAIEEKEIEEKRLTNKLRKIFERLKMRIVVQKWLANAKAKQHERSLHEEKLISDMMNFPAGNVTGKSREEILKTLRGNHKSPNIIKTGKSTMEWLNTYERITSPSQEYKNNLKELVIQNDLQSNVPHSEDRGNGTPRRFSPNYYQHCWKRRWPTYEPDEDTENHQSLRSVKSPRQEVLNANGYYSRSNGIIMGSEIATSVSICQTQSCDQSLLDEIKRFNEEIRKEKVFNFTDAEIFSSEFINGFNSGIG